MKNKLLFIYQMFNLNKFLNNIYMINIRKKLINLYNFKYLIFVLLIFLLRVMIKNLKYKPL